MTNDILDIMFMSGAEFNKLTGSYARAGGAGLRRLCEGEINTPGLISLMIIIGAIIFMYWAIRDK
ncbi:hypothetical protein KHC33_06450 [Methanospirillum sp. J.3.6.1-F.2.7.3]|jgi:hypothetical protein|uniref:Uncharacterized protein n=1 Tax=Methanospirillum purgamenti TaxID=2834276 RepID=A0A8E7AYI5_9EURY|nr:MULTISPECIES: hypothetical protein [Methanospirillum]MDX8549999.1 hypothetical protein [Methanospirillum hungatei]QVV90127.1 hypothetical protein KHC33_06450 [Methanospirillum sp. J.3.6.1-F.2.7.3]